MSPSQIMKTRHGRQVSLYRVFDIIPSIVVVFLIWVWYLCSFEVGIGYFARIHGQWLHGVIYTIISTTLIPTLLLLYLEIFMLPGSHSVPPRLTPIMDGVLYYECADMAQSLVFCHKGQCNGKWKPPRTHHCSTCGVCRVGFDHHCPWIGNCITLSVMKTFLFMLLLTSVTFFVLIIPVIPALSSHVTDALRVSQEDEWASRVWWNTWISWLALGGPPGRWIIGTIVGYRMLDHSVRGECAGRLGCLIQYPHLRVLLTAMFASFLGIFALVLGCWTARQVHRGESSLEALRSRNLKKGQPMRGPLICISPITSEAPLQVTGISARCVVSSQIMQPPCVMPALPTERPYDLGPAENWKQLAETSLFGHRRQQSQKLMRLSYPISVFLIFCFAARFDQYVLWPRLNPKMLRRMLAQSRDIRSLPDTLT